MSTLTADAFTELIREDIKWLENQPYSLEREHILAILYHAPRMYYPAGISGVTDPG